MDSKKIFQLRILESKVPTNFVSRSLIKTIRHNSSDAFYSVQAFPASGCL